VQDLETGPLHRFQDWPNGRVPKRAAGVYTFWDGDRLLYVGMSGRAMTAEDLEVGDGGSRQVGFVPLGLRDHNLIWSLASCMLPESEARRPAAPRCRSARC
jgi:hypothetical protein